MSTMIEKGMNVGLGEQEHVDMQMFTDAEGSFLRIGDDARGHVWYAATDTGWLLLNAAGLMAENDRLEALYLKKQGAMQ